ncbi:hypothetical protein [Parashewanella tropica]|nr:hypothetical protein [Parashewanella tropica]
MDFILWATKENPWVGMIIGLLFFLFLFLIKPTVMWYFSLKNKEK